MNVFVFMQLCSYAVSACFPCFLVEGVGRRGGGGGGGCVFGHVSARFLFTFCFFSFSLLVFVCLFVCLNFVLMVNKNRDTHFTQSDQNM